MILEHSLRERMMLSQASPSYQRKPMRKIMKKIRNVPKPFTS
ncbi:MAG: hypothetical protein PHQ51_04695 [Synergistales bacterium]|nr:hypothetical protein [Synergistales bacterium]